jgi:hypothetical protein
VNAGLAGAVPGEPVVLVAHSNAGVFMPVIRAGLDVRVSCSVFADATVPAERGQTPIAPPEFLEFLRGLAGPDGRLPQWTDWWDEQDVAPMFAGAERLRAAVTAEQPRLPVDYYTERVPVPGGWDDHRCGYLVFSEPYAGRGAGGAQARLAGSRAARRAPASDRGSRGCRRGDQRPGRDRGTVAMTRKTANLAAATSSTGQSGLA